VLQRSKTRCSAKQDFRWNTPGVERVTPSYGEDQKMKAKSTDVAQTDVGQTVEATANKQIEATVSTLKDGMAKATEGFESTQAKVKEGVEKAMKTAEELVSFSQGNVEAVVKAGQIWAAGVQDLSKQVAATAQATFDETISTFKALTTVKSLKDAYDLQAAYARSAMEKTMAESGKLADSSFKLTEQALAPLTARVTLAVEKFAKAA
jgi:phasin family protein